MKIICISGKAQHGKSTCAEAMREELEKTTALRVLVTNYGDLLKYIAKAYFNWNGIKDDFGRTLLQETGSKLRKYRKTFFVDFMIDILSAFHDSFDVVIIADCRFENEIDSLKREGFDVTSVRIDRGHYTGGLTKKQMRHESETSLDSYSFDYVIKNDFKSSNMYIDECKKLIHEILKRRTLK